MFIKNIFKLKPILLMFILLISSCANYTRIKNVDLNSKQNHEDYSQFKHQNKNDNIKLFLSFSGGGTRAAAFSYGILEALRDTEYYYNNKTVNLLSQVDVISSVSGGSFTSAYYGLYGDKIFDEYEDVFLKQDVQKVLINGLLNPLNWFKFFSEGFDRTELAIDYYDKNIFNGATFSDFRKDMPFIQINATDLSSGQPFIFKQEYFNLLCSDLSQYKVSRAVTASSAVPVAFAPITLKNHDQCGNAHSDMILIDNGGNEDFRLTSMKEALARYLNKDLVKYVHLVDGGISDNLGIRALYDTVNLMGGASGTLKKMEQNPPEYIIVIVVNAAVSPIRKMDGLPDEPALADQIDAVSSAQIERYSLESIQLVKDSLSVWSKELSKISNKEVKPFFIQIDFDGLQDNNKNRLANSVSTSLALPSEQVEGLRKAARELLLQSSEFQELLSELR